MLDPKLSEALSGSLPPNVIVLMAEHDPAVCAYVHAKVRGLDSIDIAQMLGALWRTLNNLQDSVHDRVVDNYGEESGRLFDEAVEVARTMPTKREGVRFIDREGPEGGS